MSEMSTGPRPTDQKPPTNPFVAFLGAIALLLITVGIIMLLVAAKPNPYAGPNVTLALAGGGITVLGAQAGLLWGLAAAITWRPRR